MSGSSQDRSTGTGLRLTVIGCSGSYPGPDSAASCYLLEADSDGRTWRILLDLGSGALGPLQQHIDPLSIDAVFLSHLHPDHFFDISGLYVLRKYHPEGPRAAIPVWGPEGVGRRCANAYGLAPDPGMSNEFTFHEYDDEPASVGPFRVSAAPVEHPVDAYGLTVEGHGRRLVYTGDTGPCGGLVELAREADLLLAEAAFREGADNPPGLHLTGKDAGEAAARAAVRCLVLTHIPPWYDRQQAFEEARPVFDGELHVALPGATYDV